MEQQRYLRGIHDCAGVGWTNIDAAGVQMMVAGSHWMLDLSSDLELGETERDFGRSSEDICEEYIVTVWGVGRTNVDA